MALGSRIRYYRQKANITLDDLGERSGVDIGTISALENRDSKRSQYASKIAAGLGMTLEMLEDESTDYDVVGLLQGSAPTTISSAHSGGGDDLFTIKQYDTGGSMGRGFLLRDQPGLIESWTVNREWATKNLPYYTNADNLGIVTGFGDSMQGMFNPGDPILVDRGITSCEVDGVYFFRVDDEGFIKRLQRIPGEGILVISENNKYRDWTIKPTMNFQVLAKVLTVWKSEQY
ncbi:S24 family peptidase [Comamonadaceae bacterium PP-2]